MSHDPERPLVRALEDVQRIARDALPLARCYDERGELLLRLVQERNELHGYVNGLLGLLQMVRRRDDMPADISEVLNTNHRVTDAAAYLTQILPPNT